MISGADGSVQGKNAFAYCFNNPTNLDDSSGNWPKLSKLFNKVVKASITVATVAVVVAACVVTAPVSITGGTVAAIVGTAVTVAKAAVVVAAAAAIADVVSTGIKKVVENTTTISNTQSRNQSVYVMRDSASKDVKYIGRTNNPSRRKQEHNRDASKSHLDPLEVKFTGLTKSEAMVVEQLLISAYSLEYLDNARREIAVGNVGKFTESIGNIITLFGSVQESEALCLMEGW